MMNKKMKNIYLFRAMPGSGKSTLINDYELQSNTLSLDTFRELLSGVSLGLNGNIGIDQQYNDHVSFLFKEAFKKRMQEGAVIIVDNLNNKISDLNSYYILGTKYGYNVKVVNFELKELDFYKQRNKQRSERKQLPLESIESLYKSFSEIDLSLCQAEIISVQDFRREINTPILDLCVNLNEYDKINHIGDIMGANQPLDKFLLNYNKNEFYIFLGNYFDLGNSPDLVVKTLKKISKEKNVVFLRGNYDKKLGYFINDLEVRDDNFNEITKDKLIEHKEFIRDFYYNKQIDYFAYKYLDKNVFVNNAGVSNIPLKPYLINSSVFVEGVGSKTFDISACFNNNAPSNWVQIHGYRNFKNNKNNQVKDKSFSLESSVAVGGSLSVASLSSSGISIAQYKNKDVNPKTKYIYEKEFFSTFKDTDFHDLKKALKRENINDALASHFENEIVYSINNQVISIRNKNNDSRFASVRDKSINSYFISNINGNPIVTDSQFNRVYIDIPNKILELSNKFNSVAHCSFENNEFIVMDFYRIDKNKNKLKNSLFNDFSTKSEILYFNNKNALDGFIKSIKNGKNKKFKSDIIIEYEGGQSKIINVLTKNKHKNRL